MQLRPLLLGGLAVSHSDDVLAAAHQNIDELLAAKGWLLFIAPPPQWSYVSRALRGVFARMTVSRASVCMAAASRQLIAFNAARPSRAGLGGALAPPQLVGFRSHRQ
ncbi:hypothetical protein CU560_02580 [Serratia ureilytica]|nr:hypothetical protein CU560_02580 [Serratia ureilytica]